MRNQKKLALDQLEEKLKSFQKAEKVALPERGWIHAIRTTLNMTLEQLGAKLNITRQGIKSLEDSEAKGAISLNSLREAGKAMELKLVYGFVPIDGTFNNLIQRKAEELARKIVLRTNHNMILEDQGIGNDKIVESIKELTEELKREMRRSLWD